jgi:hypothetical protein
MLHDSDTKDTKEKKPFDKLTKEEIASLRRFTDDLGIKIRRRCKHRGDMFEPRDKSDICSKCTGLREREA